MDRKDFGKLVSALRQDMEWTQFNLAEYADIDLAVISQIERGAKKHFEPELLVKLANVFHLTTLERKEFFFASTGVQPGKIVRQPSAALATDTVDADKSLTKMANLVGQLRVPAFLLDVYSDVLAINQIAVAFFQIPQAMFETAGSTVGGYNAIRLVFGKDLAARSKITESWDEYALRTMCFFREVSLRYRARPYFQSLMKAFRNPVEYPLFNRYWKLVSSIEQDREANVDLFSYTHVDFGHLSYATATTVSLTPYGELLLNQYLPLDDPTSRVFEQLTAQCGQGAIRLAPWPVKK
ncbi:MAG: helix-turn-helix domain-containing protein [Chloroflexi bacterium]|nr:helix-turn-helix domain-containing protein [Chloroflexota bacterium]